MIETDERPRQMEAVEAQDAETTDSAQRIPQRPVVPQLNYVCRICGLTYQAEVHRSLCDSPDCQRERANQRAREWYWRHVHGQEPPLRSTYRQTCVICGRKLDQSAGPPIIVCSPKCERLRIADRWRAYYQRNREKVLGQQRARAQKRAGVAE